MLIVLYLTATQKASEVYHSSRRASTERLVSPRALENVLKFISSATHDAAFCQFKLA